MIKTYINKLCSRENLSYEEMREAMLLLMQGKTSDAQNAAFLVALTMKGETKLELLAAAEVMRELSTKVHIDDIDSLVDPVGTGGTMSRLFNVSTAASIVAACGGVRIAKHGSRAASSKSGSADLLEQAGVNINLTTDQLATCVNDVGIGFMFAPNLHKAMAYVIGARRDIGVRTFFNILGPLTNPSGAKKQLLGLYTSERLLEIAELSRDLKQKHVMVVHSDDGLDEVSIAAPTQVCELKDDVITSYSLNPKDYGMAYDNIDSLRVDSPQESLELIKSAFDGKTSSAYDMIAINSACIMYIGNVAIDIKDGLDKSYSILSKGLAKKKLEEYIDYTKRFC